MKIKRFNEKLEYYDIVTNLKNLILNDLSYVSDICSYELLPQDDGTVLGFRPKVSGVTIKDIIYDIIPFYEKLIKDYDVGHLSYRGIENYLNIQFLYNGRRETIRLSKYEIINNDISEIVNLDYELVKLSIFLDYYWDED